MFDDEAKAWAFKEGFKAGKQGQSPFILSSGPLELCQEWFRGWREGFACKSR